MAQIKDKSEVMLADKGDPKEKIEGGLRTKGYFKTSYDGKPLISVITVVYNGEKYLEQTIQSVINQTYDNVEYIIIDGGSTDGTLDIIKKYEHAIDYWVSERDRGIYDAMNKGIDAASGEWINFMNAGDGFYANDTLEIIFSKNRYKNDNLIYGKTNIGYKILKCPTRLSLNDMAKGMSICHQSAFYKKSNSIRYNLKYRLCADQDFTIQYLIQNEKPVYLDHIISTYNLEGVSAHSLNKITLEKFMVNKHYGFSYTPILKSYFISLLVKLRTLIKGY